LIYFAHLGIQQITCYRYAYPSPLEENEHAILFNIWYTTIWNVYKIIDCSKLCIVLQLNCCDLDILIIERSVFRIWILII